MRRTFVLTLTLLCSTTLAAPPASTQPSRSYLLHLPGIGGKCWLDLALLAGLKQAGLSATADIYDWTCKDPGLDALLARPRNEEQAQKIADRLTSYARAHPHVPIHLTSHSGGGGLAVWALEKCPPDVHVETLFLIAPALSPAYDLTPALRHVRSKAYVFYSDGDSAVLGIGTRLFGTIDGQKTDAAGKVGFTRPPTGDPAEYAKIVPMPYQSAWMQYENIGDHIGPMMTPFARAVIAPLILGQIPVPATKPSQP